MDHIDDNGYAWARKVAVTTNDEAWPTVSQIVELHPKLTMADAHRMCSIIQRAWTAGVIDDLLKKGLDSQSLQERWARWSAEWKRKTRNIEEFPGRDAFSDIYDGYTPESAMQNQVQRWFSDKLVDRHLLNYRGVYASREEIETQLPAPDLVPIFTRRDWLAVMFRYMHRMASLKDRGPKWKEQMQEIREELAEIDANNEEKD